MVADFWLQDYPIPHIIDFANLISIEGRSDTWGGYHGRKRHYKVSARDWGN